ncbi:cytochrome c oxidase subunit VIa-domain-containing protein [Fennellomyces sp. T-0311]|nr:cytochrome c oxidase subunit VIa-domain-containing protein [Fennellomyces sp. T-0311]
MASRALFNPQLQLVKRAGVRYTSSFVAEREAVKHHAAQSAETWKKISLFVCIPALLASGVNAYNLAVAHMKHQEEHPHKWVQYPYMNWRVKDYFWGKDSLFFNPKVNHSAADE